MNHHTIVQTGAAAAIAVLVGIGWHWQRSYQQVVEATRLEDRNRVVVAELSELLCELRSVETETRGFCLTGAPRFLEPLRMGFSGVERRLVRLKTLTGDNRHQQQCVLALEPLVTAKMALLQHEVDSQRNKVLDAAQAQELTLKGELMMEQIHQQVEAFRAEEEQLLGEELRQRKLGLEQALMTGRAGGLFSCGVLVGSLALLERENRRRRKVEEALLAHGATLEQTVTERTRQQRELVEDLEHFSYTITHDMRAPLRAVFGFAELASLRLAAGHEQEVLRLLGQVRAAAKRMDLLITDALNYSRAVQEQLPLSPVDTAVLLPEIVGGYPEFLACRESIALEGRLPVVLGNEAALTQCFSNLLNNAVKFVKPGQAPAIRVWAERREEWTRIWVEDQGVGIPAAMVPRVFDLFCRGHQGYEGTGIGLALVRKVVRRMGGRVGVESTEGQGSRFWVELQKVRTDE